MATRILIDPAADLSDEPAAGAVTLTATLLAPNPLAVKAFTVEDSTSVVELAAPDSGEAWRLSARRGGHLVDERTVHFPDLPTVAWADLTDVDPATLQPGAGGPDTAWQAALDDLRTQVEAGGGGGGGGGTVSDATTTSKGIIQLAGDLAGTASAPTVPGLAGKATPAQITAAIAALGLGTASQQPISAFDAAGAAATAQAFAIQRANHTGTQSADTLTDGTAQKAFTAAERTKLTGVAAGATANRSDAATDSLLAAKADLVAGLVPTSQIPALALTTAVSVASQAAMLALTTAQVQPGDIAVRTDGAGSFILTATDPSILGNWTRINAPTDTVTSVNGQQGTVVLAATDVGADPAGSSALRLAKASNLSDLASAATARANLGLATVAASGAYSDLSGTPTIPAAYTDEQAQDAVAALFAAGTHTGITFTYDDAGNRISAAITGGSSTSTSEMATPGVGEWVAITGPNINGNIGNAAGVAVFSELWLPAGTYDQVAFYVGAAAAGAFARVALFADDGVTGGGKPGTLLFGSAAIDASTTGLKTVTGVGLTVASYRRVWCAVVGQGATLGFAGVNAATNQSVGGNGVTAQLSYGSTANAWNLSGVTGAFPSTVTVTNRNDYGFRVAAHRSA